MCRLRPSTQHRCAVRESGRWMDWPERRPPAWGSRSPWARQVLPEQSCGHSGKAVAVLSIWLSLWPLLSMWLRLPPCAHTPTDPGVSKRWPNRMPILFQGPVGEETLTTAAAAVEAPLSTSEEEEAHGVPTDGLAPLTPTAAPEHAVTSAVTSVSVSWHLVWLTVGGRGQCHKTGTATSPPQRQMQHSAW